MTNSLNTQSELDARRGAGLDIHHAIPVGGLT